MKTPTDITIEEIFSLYERFGSADYIGEPVSQIEHMSQSAQLAMESNADDLTILAAFFHDIGHLCFANADAETMNGYGVKRHEQVGADFLRSKAFPEVIARLVAYHVQAKRYLTFKDPAYYAQLSDASRNTLIMQGGLMTKEEADLFENDPLFDKSIQMRKWDEMAKRTAVPVMDLNILKDKARKVLLANIAVV